MSSTPRPKPKVKRAPKLPSYATKQTIPSVQLTQRETSVELQVRGEESSETAEQFATRLPSIQLIAAVDKTIGRGAIVGFVQNPYQQLPLTDHHLK